MITEIPGESKSHVVYIKYLGLLVNVVPCHDVRFLDFKNRPETRQSFDFLNVLMVLDVFEFGHKADEVVVGFGCVEEVLRW